MEALDLNGPAEARLYAWRPDGGASEPTTYRLCECGRGDINGDGSPDAVDINVMIHFIHFNGPTPCDPCE